MSQKETNMLLYAAIISKNIEFVSELLEDGAFIDFDENEGIAAWFIANNTKLGGGNQELIEVLLEHGTDIEAVDEFNHTVLYYAVEESDTDMTRFLLEHDAIINCVEGGDTPLIIRATRDNNIEIVKLLIDYGADLNGIDENGGTALLEATRNQNIELVELLIDNGSELDKKANEGHSPLYWAEAQDNMKMMNLLLESGADPDIDVTVTFADLDIDLGKAASLLNSACSKDNTKMAYMLLEYGANPNGQTGDMKITCLHWACGLGNFELVKKLVENGADTKAKDLTGRTPALTALSKGFNEIFNYLLLK